MPDITMCNDGGECSQNEHCYRFMAVPSHWQSFANFYQAETDGSCVHFMQIYKTDRIVGRIEK